MSKIAIFIFLLLLIALGLFAIENTEAINVKIPFGSNYEVSKVAFLILTLAIGAFSILLIFFVRDSMRAIDKIKISQRQKKDAKNRLYYTRAFNAILAQRNEDARQDLKALLKSDPDHLDSLLRLGDIALKESDYQGALDYYKKAYELSRSNSEVLLSLGTALEKIGSYDDALKYLDEALSIDSRNLTALQMKRSIYEKKLSWDNLISIQESILNLQYYEKGKRKEQKRIMAYKFEYAKTYLENKQLEKAESLFKELLNLKPNFIPFLIGLSEVFSKNGKVQEAIRILENASERLNYSIALLIKLDDLLWKSQESERLIRLYKKALLKNANDNRLKFLLAQAYCKEKRHDDALEILESSGDVASFPDYYILRGKLYLKQEQDPKALEDFKRSLEMLQTCRQIYYCLQCGERSSEWSGKCYKCMEWNTYSEDAYEFSKS